MDMTNKLFKVTSQITWFYLYFERDEYYQLLSDGEICLEEGDFYHFKPSSHYIYWKREIESFFWHGYDLDDIFQYQETPLEALLTSRYKVWQRFAKERL